MARKASNSMSSRLTRFETIAGWLYLPFYLIILNLLLQLANEKLSLGMSALTINIAYFAINLAATLLIFHQGHTELLVISMTTGPIAHHVLCPVVRSVVNDIEIQRPHILSRYRVQTPFYQFRPVQHGYHHADFSLRFHFHHFSCCKEAKKEG